MTKFIVNNKDRKDTYELSENITFNEVIAKIGLDDKKNNVTIFTPKSIVITNYDESIKTYCDIYIINIMYDDIEINFLPSNKKFVSTMTFNEVINKILLVPDKDKLKIVSENMFTVSNYEDKIGKYGNNYYIGWPIR